MVVAVHPYPFAAAPAVRSLSLHRGATLRCYRPARLATVAARSTGGTGSDQASAGPEGGQPEGARPAYEQARDELIDLVKQLEAGGLTLEQSLQLWERGEELAAICQDWLEGARARLATALAKREKSGQDPDAPF